MLRDAAGSQTLHGGIVATMSCARPGVGRNQGHRRIAYLRPSGHFTSVERRVEAFRTWTQARNLSLQQAPLYELEFEYAAPALDAMLALPKENRPTAVCCWNDVTAFDLLMHCHCRAVPVPEALAVVGFDGLLTDPRLNPRALVTVGASWPEITERAVDLLTRQIDRRCKGSSLRARNKNQGGETEDIPLLTCLPVTRLTGNTA